MRKIECGIASRHQEGQHNSGSKKFDAACESLQPSPCAAGAHVPESSDWIPAGRVGVSLFLSFKPLATKLLTIHSSA